MGSQAFSSLTENILSDNGGNGKKKNLEIFLTVGKGKM